jgi:hypothetical protein
LLTRCGRGRRLVLAALALAIVTAFGGTCSTARLPPRAAIAEPCTVFLLQTPIHPILVLPDEQGRFFGYGFGDRTYMSTFDWTQVPWAAWLVVVGIPGRFTSGAMERHAFRGTTREQLALESGMDAEEFVVERPRVAALRRALEARIGAPVAGQESWLFETGDDYSLWWNNCHGATAEWLRELGGEVPRFRLAPRFTGWTIEQ